MFNTPCQEYRRQPFWSKLIVIVALVGMLGFFSAHAGLANAAAAPPIPSVDQFGHPAPQPAAEKAYAADKTRLSNEYVKLVLTGKEPLADFEIHYRVFMLKWHLGDVANLHTALMRGTARLRSNVARLSGPECPSVAHGPAALCPVWAAQFPEESFNWCGPATLSTTVVENSFSWPGANTYGSVTMSYDAYHVTQPSGLATNDEYWLGVNGVIQPPQPPPPNWLYIYGTSVDAMTTMLNHFTNGHGGNYVPFQLIGSTSYQISNFQNKVSSDIGTGWDVPTGIIVPAYSGASMPGYPVNYRYEIDHWVPVTFISSDLNTTYYSDPIYAAPAYTSPTWNIPPPYENTPTSNIVWWGSYILW